MTLPVKGLVWLDLVSAVPAKAAVGVGPELGLGLARFPDGDAGWQGAQGAMDQRKPASCAGGTPEALQGLTELLLVLYLFLFLHWVYWLWFLALCTANDSTLSVWWYVCTWHLTAQTVTGLGS